MEFIETGLPGCCEIQCRVLKDGRGTFTKTFHHDEFQQFGLRTDWKEEYYSRSSRNVIRGMHFQTPPAEHAKLVYCLAGEILDVVLDLRKGSPTFGEYREFKLSPEAGNSIYIPMGCAHGFLSLTDDSVVHYKVTSMYAPANDHGLLWSSFGFGWPTDHPIVSDRDMAHPRLDDYDSPFFYGE